MSLSLFGGHGDPEYLTAHTVLLSGYVLEEAEWIQQELSALVQQAPFRRMVTPQGKMSVDTTSWGPWGWTSDDKGYRYAKFDPITQNKWPAIPKPLLGLASKAAERAGYTGFIPDSCLVNRYSGQAKMGLHQDKNERDFNQPIVSFSLGASATFLWGGNTRSDPVSRLTLHHGDVLVFGGPDRLRFHGIAGLLPSLETDQPLYRLNLTFRKVS